MTSSVHSANGNKVTAVILAGGRARRMAGADKALLPLAGRPLLAHVIETLRPQVAELIISSNRPAASYAAFGLPVVADSLPGQCGPLAGLLSALDYTNSELLLTVPCDTPFLPCDLVARMLAALESEQADVCTVSSGDRTHAAIMLVRRKIRASLHTYLAAGDRQVLRWQQGERLAVVDYSDQPEAFCNINTPEQLNELEKNLPRHEC